MTDFSPRHEHRFSFGLWTVGNRGRDPFGDVVRPVLAPADAVAMLAEVGAWGGNLHDDESKGHRRLNSAALASSRL